MKDPARLYLMPSSGLDVVAYKPKSGSFTEYVRKDLISNKTKPKAEQYANQLVYVVECMLSASPGGSPNTHFGLSRAQAKTLMVKIKGDQDER